MNINLLPWREERRNARKKQFSLIMMATVVVSLFILIVVYLWLSQQINAQQSRNSFLRAEARILDKKILEIKNIKEQRNQLLSRMQVIQGMKGNRPVIVHLFDELVRVVPQGIYFSELEMEGRNLTIKGVAENNNSISALMRNLDNSKWFDDPNLTAVKALDAGEGSQFNLNVEHVMPSALGEIEQ